MNDMRDPRSPLNVVVIGTGEYVTGFLHGNEASRSDKGAGVIALVLFDLRRRGRVGRIILAGRDGRRFPASRTHLQARIADRYAGLDTTLETVPADDSMDPRAYAQALDRVAPGAVAIIATPDDMHSPIAQAALDRGLHTLVVKPLVKTLAEHDRLLATARARGLLLAAEYHKRFDPIYADARDRIQGLGDMSLLLSYMSQPKLQLETFRDWAGTQSDIGYYLNAHHIDFHAWSLRGRARPVRARATAATGVASEVLRTKTEDAIALTVEWESFGSGRRGVAVYTASWVAPRADVHSQQRFFYMGAEGEVTVDQAHRGYSVATDALGFMSENPLFMKYAPTDGRFAGQAGYGYRSIEAFIEAAEAVSCGAARPEDFDASLATAATGRTVTAILEAGRRSLDAGGLAFNLRYADAAALDPVSIDPE